ncbi:MAG: amino acid ABC transporter substrate-binding protein [Acidimicrobiaceae bacterium]|nr:amino acid ABC transporter substrate-binding protein [Acidimicrobiaceae bacterium]
MGRLSRVLMLLCVMGLCAAGCGSDDEVTAVADDVAEDADAVEAAGTIRIGAALSETGRFAGEGKAVRQGYDTWVRWVNEERGGVKLPDGSYEVEIVYYDDESDADTAADLVRRLIDEDDVDFLLGPYSSSLTTGSSAVSEAAGVLMVQGTASADSMYQRGFENLFGVATIASDYTKTGIESFAAQGAETAVIVHHDSPFAVAVANGAVEHFEANGIEVLSVETYTGDPTDLASIISEFARLDPDVFLGGGLYSDAVNFVDVSERVGFDPDGMLVTVGPSNPKFSEELGDSAEGVVGPTQWEATMAYEGQWFGSAADYAALYESWWSEPPVYQAASATAAALALHVAVERAGSTDTEAVRSALGETEMLTFYGPIGFDERGVNALKPMGAVQVQDGAINVVAPRAAAVADLAFPRN